MSPLPEVVARIDEVVLWILGNLCSGASQQYYCTNPPRGMELDLRPFPMAYEVYMCRLGRQIRVAVVIAKCVNEDLPWLGYIRIGSEVLVSGSSPLTG